MIVKIACVLVTGTVEEIAAELREQAVRMGDDGFVTVSAQVYGIDGIPDGHRIMDGRQMKSLADKVEAMEA